jgi:hypothetical protein
VVDESEPASLRDKSGLPFQEGAQPLKNCPECGKGLNAYNKRHCYQCLKPTCKRCNKGLPLCPEHFAGLPSDGKEELLSAIRSERIRNKIAFAGFCIILVGFAFGLIGLFAGVNEHPEMLNPFLFTFFGIMVVGGIVMYSPITTLPIHDPGAMVLKKHGVKVRYSRFERGHMAICQVCGERTLWKKSWNCGICSKILCVNCRSAAGLCPQHAASIDPASASELEQLEGKERRVLAILFVLMVCLFISCFTLLIPGSDAIGISWVLPAAFLAFCASPFIFLAWMSKSRKRIVNRIPTREK